MADMVTTFLAYEVAGITLEDYWWAALAFVLSMLLLKLFEKVVVARLRALSRRTKTEVDDLVISFIDDIGLPFYVIVSLLLTIRLITVPGIVTSGMRHLTVIVATFYVVKAVQRVIDFGVSQTIKKRKAVNPDDNISIVSLLARLLKVLLWLIAGVLVLANLGYNITTLVAGLGIGGIAIALALQNLLQDIFASISIYFDRPFEVGDFIVIGTDKGTVKEIGIKSTRLQTLDGPELVVSNKELTDTRVQNYKKMDRRRGIFTFGVTYNTPVKKLERIPGIVERIIARQEQAEFDRVHFTTFGDFSLNFEVVYYMKVSDYKAYRDTQQSINLAIMETFQKERITFAFPTQTVFVDKA